jgi:3-phenylpropionate/trans-cinnamate dioxygenase ferredoxin reductase subunit
MNHSKYVIFGGGMVAGYAAKELVERGLKPGELAILSADTAMPYERPPLSKGFLAGKETESSIRINAEEFYREHGIHLQLGCEVLSVDAARKVIRLKSGKGGRQPRGSHRRAREDAGRPREGFIRGPLSALA